MLANLRNATDTQLLEFVRDILAKVGPLHNLDRLELRQINDEFIRRDAARAADICHYCYQIMSSGPRCSHCGSL